MASCRPLAAGDRRGGWLTLMWAARAAAGHQEGSSSSVVVLVKPVGDSSNLSGRP